MNSRLLLVPLAAIAAVSPAYAVTYLSVEQAQALMFPNTLLTPVTFMLTAEQISAVEHASGVKVFAPQIQAWRSADGGWFLLDQVIGKHELISYALALDSSGTIKQVEILDYRESYGGEIRVPAWRKQFVGKRAGAPLVLDDDIKNISGATLSCRHVTEGIRKMLTVYATALAGQSH
ncbi:MAG: FMN-binding protein [Rhizobium sp.]|nr:MAG: FMN-binding protein [Rhizobium sp.]